MSTHQVPGFTRGPRIADQLTPDLMECARSATRAERAGDAAEALEWHRAVPMFARGRHMAILGGLAQFGGDLPPWVWVRWLAYQTVRCDDRRTTTGDQFRAMVKYATETIHPELLRECYERGGDPVQVLARITAQSWFVHQFFTHEAGGLVNYIDEFVDTDRFPHVDLARRWAEVPLSGYRIGDGSGVARVRVHDPVTDAAVTVLDLGARSGAGPGGWVLGRLVPSGLGDLAMFDRPPLPVTEQIASETSAASKESRWSPITAALREGRLEASAFLREDYELLSDVQELDLLAYGTPAADLERVMRQLRSGRDEVGRAAFRILRDAVDGRVPDGDATWVAAAALNPHAHTEASHQLCRPGGREEWLRWASLVASPGTQRLTALADACVA